MLGTNDSWSYNWGWSEKTSFKAYQENYAEMVKSFRDLPSKPKIYVMIPPPIYKETLDSIYQIEFWGAEEKINALYPVAIPMMADKMGIPKDQVIDLFTPFGGAENKYPFLYEDGLHPNDEGYKVMARTIYCHIETCKKGWEKELEEGMAEVQKRTGGPG